MLNIFVKYNSYEEEQKAVTAMIGWRRRRALSRQAPCIHR